MERIVRSVSDYRPRRHFVPFHARSQCTRFACIVTHDSAAFFPVCHFVSRLLDERGLSSFQTKLIPHVRGHTIAWSHRTSWRRSFTKTAIGSPASRVACKSCSVPSIPILRRRPRH
jgi:hypothetical protein